jgi:hypothetical protein
MWWEHSAQRDVAEMARKRERGVRAFEDKTAGENREPWGVDRCDCLVG